MYRREEIEQIIHLTFAAVLRNLKYKEARGNQHCYIDQDGLARYLVSVGNRYSPKVFYAVWDALRQFFNPHLLSVRLTPLPQPSA